MHKLLHTSTTNIPFSMKLGETEYQVNPGEIVEINLREAFQFKSELKAFPIRVVTDKD